MTAAERNTLITFLRDLRVLIDSVVTRHLTWAPVELQTPMRVAWLEIEPRFSEVIAAIRGRQRDSALDATGLSGRSLQFKMAGWRRALQRFRRSRAPSLLLRALKWADVALGTIAALFDAAEPIKEFKEAMESAVEEQSAG